jgi:lactose/L-arabinose transport system permease protein
MVSGVCFVYQRGARGLRARAMTAVRRSPLLTRLWRVLVFVPHVTSMVAVGYTFKLMLSESNGLFNLVLGWVGLPGVPWLGDTWWARISLSLLMIWAWLGHNTVIMLAGLQTIPRDLVECARVDGATSAQAFLRITVPLMRPVILFSVTLSIIGTFSMFTEPYILTLGGPARATETPIMQIFSTAFSFLKLGHASAMAYVYLAIIAAAAIIQLRLFSREETA